MKSKQPYTGKLRIVVEVDLDAEGRGKHMTVAATSKGKPRLKIRPTFLDDSAPAAIELAKTVFDIPDVLFEARE